jgi:transcriptional regulator with XRE-family HTH domain
MPITTWAERLIRIREAAGYGGPRQAANFARKIGITPPSLSDLESGKTKTLGKSLSGYIRIGANIEYVEKGKGPPMLLKNIERNIENSTLISMIDEMNDDQRKIVFDVAKGLLRVKEGPSKNDPFKIDAPKSGD